MEWKYKHAINTKTQHSSHHSSCQPAPVYYRFVLCNSVETVSKDKCTNSAADTF